MCVCLCVLLRYFRVTLVMLACMQCHWTVSLAIMVWLPYVMWTAAMHLKATACIQMYAAAIILALTVVSMMLQTMTAHTKWASDVLKGNLLWSSGTLDILQQASLNMCLMDHWHGRTYMSAHYCNACCIVFCLWSDVQRKAQNAAHNTKLRWGLASAVKSLVLPKSLQLYTFLLTACLICRHTDFWQELAWLGAGVMPIKPKLRTALLPDLSKLKLLTPRLWARRASSHPNLHLTKSHDGSFWSSIKC